MQSTTYRSNQSVAHQSKVSKLCHRTHNIEVSTKVNAVAEEVEDLMEAETAKEGAGVSERLIAPCVAKMRVISQRIANTTKLLEN